jgi:hypothetical protein
MQMNWFWRRKCEVKTGKFADEFGGAVAFGLS